MALNSLNPAFISRNANSGQLSPARRKPHAIDEMLASLLDVDFNTAIDRLHSYAMRHCERNDADTATATLEEMAALLAEKTDLTSAESDLHAALLSTLTALQIERNRYDEALVVGANALSLLASEAKRKDEPFLTILACILFDLAQIQSQRGEIKQAERKIEKSTKILERLARIDANRYGPAHIMALDVASGIYRSAVKQANLLAHAQVATATYLDMINGGEDDPAVVTATEGLIDSLTTQGVMLLQMDKPRQAIGFFTRALKLLSRINPENNIQQLTLSVHLGEALIANKATSDKGVHLLNTALHKATKLGADDLHQRITEILGNLKTNRLDIITLWHKFFPK